MISPLSSRSGRSANFPFQSPANVVFASLVSPLNNPSVTKVGLVPSSFQIFSTGISTLSCIHEKVFVIAQFLFSWLTLTVYFVRPSRLIHSLLLICTQFPASFSSTVYTIGLTASMLAYIGRSEKTTVPVCGSFFVSLTPLHLPAIRYSHSDAQQMTARRSSSSPHSLRPA